MKEINLVIQIIMITFISIHLSSVFVYKFNIKIFKMLKSYKPFSCVNCMAFWSTLFATLYISDASLMVCLFTASVAFYGVNLLEDFYNKI